MNRPILIVEDDPDDEMLMRRAFKKINIANPIDVVNDGEEALHYLFRTGPFQDRTTPAPQVVLLDINLPKFDGLQVLSRIRENEATKMQPVVMLTSSDEQEDLLRSYELAANSYVRKPVDFDQFAQSVTNIGLFWMLVNNPPPEG
ncbi:hypothetical protein FHR99_002377 [Litorivivens lipolytica]|uniref:Response regulatory domain-containing protein n=1 Tax=Litorivivens lipolytica TaxID=1524264 RepID=A0A7W4W606_9GAMM|nr:response regulator [Litorivivens lipolytica]MBB3048111.1 hypothetical protein [Litorivivens lipolytica]